MKKLLIVSFLAMLASSVFATDSVRLQDVTDHVVYGLNGSTYPLFDDEPSGDASSETAPHTIYVPTGNSSIANQNEYFYLSRNGKTVLDVTVNNRSTMAIIFPLRLNISTVAKYITIAVKVNGTYKVVGQSTSTYSNATNSSVDFYISPYELCSTFAVSGSTNPCNASSTFTTDMTTFLYVTDSSLAIGTTVDPTQFAGIYSLLKFSNVISTITTTISEVRVGDRRVTLTFTSSGTLANARAVRVYDFDGNDPSIPPAGETIGSQTSGGLTSQETAYVQNGSVVVTDLQNQVNYILSLTFIDKYGFTTLLSPSANATPLYIEELLKKNQCFLLTAGFGQDHYVIDYFRHFRDHVLAHSFLGRAFIHTYYELAPKYALMIYTHEGIRATIRGAAYILYFIFNYAFVLVLLTGGAALVYLYRRRNIKVG